ncbi:MAG: DNA-processing protein DprA [Aestuariivirga sp.]
MMLAALSDDERLQWHRLAQCENVGPITFKQLLARFASAAAALDALPELSRRGGSRRVIRIYDAGRAEADFVAAARLGARYVAFCESDYPELLRHAPAPPPLICVKGHTDLIKLRIIAMVGARNASANGMRFTRQIAGELGQADFVIVSGLARGIDTAAHEASLSAGTIAVVAGGIDHIYPPENAKLQDAIAERGLVLSEMPPGTVPKAESFPRRNRIIAGLAEATVVVEAALRSGSLTTARFANEAGREVYAVPGSPLDPRCEGTNGLIKDGANLLQRASDISGAQALLVMQLHEEPMHNNQPTHEAPSALRARVAQLLSPTLVEVDDLVRESGGRPEEVQGILLELELAGEVQRSGGGRIARIGSSA